MMTAVQRSITTLFVGVALGAFAVAALVWWWLGPRRDD